MTTFRRCASALALVAIATTAASAAADCPHDMYNKSLTLRLRDEDPECYKHIETQLAKRKEFEKFHDKKIRRRNWFFGELQAELNGGVTNKFESWNSGIGVLLDDADVFWGIEGGWKQKKWLRDFWAAIGPDSYLKLNEKKRAAVEALTFTGTVGYTAVVDDVLQPKLKNEFTYTVKAAYTLKFDKFTGDLD